MFPDFLYQIQTPMHEADENKTYDNSLFIGSQPLFALVS